MKNRFKKLMLAIFAMAAVAMCALALAACGGGYVEKLSVKGKTYYMVGDEFAGATLTVTYSDGRREQVDVTADMANGFDTTVAGNKTIAVVYGGKTVAFDITVSELYASGISVADGGKTEYLIGAQYADGDASINVSYTDGTVQTVPITGGMISGLDTTVEGEKTVSVKYGMLDTAYTVTVRYPYVVSATVASSTKSVYRVGDEFGGVTLDVVYEDDTSGSVTLTDIESVKGFDTTGIGPRTVRVTYRNRTVSYDIQVLKAIAGVTVKNSVGMYAKGDAFKGAELAVEYADGTSETVAVTPEMLTEFDTMKVGDRIVKLMFENRELTFGITVYGKFADDGGDNKIQVEDGDLVDMSGAQLQNGATNKFESTTKNAQNEEYSNGAEGSSTANISVEGNKIVIRFIAERAGKYKLGMRAQSGSDAGKSDVKVSDAFDISVNGDIKTASGVIQKGSATGVNWKDMTNWTMLDDLVGEIDIVAGLNEIEFAFKGGTAQAMRFPNIDYFVLTAV